MKIMWSGVITDDTGYFLHAYIFNSYDAALAFATEYGYTISTINKFKKIHDNGSTFWIEECLVRE